MTILPSFDLILGSDDDDRLAGIRHSEVIIGFGGDDRIAGRGGDDALFGNSGDDRMFGGRGDDFMSGGSGDDLMRGGGGDDRLLGRNGHDTLEGGRGDDTLLGGEGRDQFVFNPDRNKEGDDLIRDFTLGEDLVVLDVDDVLAATPDLAGAIVANGGDVAAVLTALDESADWGLEAGRGGDLVITHPTGSIRLDGIPAEAASSFADLAGALAVEGLGSVLTSLDVEGRPASIASVVAESGGTPDDNGSDFDLLLTALDLAGLTSVLADEEGEFTVFAPNDDAFISLAQRLGFEGNDEAGALEAIVAALTDLGGGDPIGPLTNVLTYHVLGDGLTLGELNAQKTVSPLFEDAMLGIDGDTIVDTDPDFSDAIVIASDIQTGNGLINVIDEVLLPLDL